MTQADLFARSALIAGLDYREDFISRDEERALLDRLRAMDLAPFRFHGWIGNRKTQSFGWRYDFDDASFQPTEPIPDWLQPLRDKPRPCARRTATRSPTPSSPATIRRRHRLAQGPQRVRARRRRVAGVRRRPCASGSARPTASGASTCRSNRGRPICLSGEARHEWEHRIVPGEELRFSITFRTMSDLGRRKAAEAQRIS